MTAPKQASKYQASTSKESLNESGGNFYTVPGFDDRQFVRVTTAINAMSKPALYNAYAKRAGVRAVDQEQEWHAIQYEECERLRTRTRNPLGPDEAMEKANEGARKWIARAMKDYSKYAAECGSGVHKLCEMYDQAHLASSNYRAQSMPSYDTTLKTMVLPVECMDKVRHHAEAMAGYQGTISNAYARMQRHFEQYHRFIAESGAKILATEMTVANPEFGYAGTLDNIVQMDGKNYVLDIKTGFVSQESVPLQLAAYRHADWYVVGDKSVRQDTPIDGAIVLQLKPQSYKAEFVQTDEDALCAFLDTLSLWKWQQEGSKDALGEKWR